MDRCWRQSLWSVHRAWKYQAAVGSVSESSRSPSSTLDLNSSCRQPAATSWDCWFVLCSYLLSCWCFWWRILCDCFPALQFQHSLLSVRTAWRVAAYCPCCGTLWGCSPSLVDHCCDRWPNLATLGLRNHPSRQLLDFVRQASWPWYSSVSDCSCFGHSWLCCFPWSQWFHFGSGTAVIVSQPCSMRRSIVRPGWRCHPTLEGSWSLSGGCWRWNCCYWCSWWSWWATADGSSSASMTHSSSGERRGDQSTRSLLADEGLPLRAGCNLR